MKENRTTHIGNSFMESVRGVLEIGQALATPFLRSRRQRWGATEEEIAGTYPGDNLITHPNWAADHAISIAAPPEQIWPWIVQIGQGRGGFYAYEKLENLAGCQIVNASCVLQEHQRVEVGDPIRLHAGVPPMRVAVVDEPKALVLCGNPAEDDDNMTLSTSWAFLLLEQVDGTTRFLSRTRYSHSADLRSRLMGGPLLIEPVSFVMERKMLQVIKELAESSRC